MVSVVGYSFNADTFCLECTREYAERQLMDRGFSEDIAEVQFSDYSLEALTKLVKDSEGNDLHPIFDTDEQLDSDAVCSCGETILEKNYEQETETGEEFTYSDHE